MKTLRLTVLTIAVMALVFGATAANADEVKTYSITTPNDNSFGAGPYGTIVASLNTTTHVMSVSISMLGSYTIKSQNGTDIGFNGDATAGNSFSFIAGSSSGAPSGGDSLTVGSGTVSTFGNFAITLDHLNNTNAPPNDANYTAFSFQLGNVNDLDSLHTEFVVHVVGANGFTGYAITTVTGGGCDTNGENCGNNGCSLDDPSCGATHQTPEPASLVLLGSGLLGIGGISRKRFAKKAF